MKIWLDDIRPAPEGYVEVKTVNDAKQYITTAAEAIELLDLDHDLGDFAEFGGDAIKLLDWLEEMSYNIPIRLHTMNPVGRQNMERIIRKNNWKYVR